MAYTLQLKRHVNYENKAEALKGLKTYLATAAVGEPAIATYGGGDTIDPEKVLFGIKGAEDYTIFDYEAIPADVQAALDSIKGEGYDEDGTYATLKAIADALTIINGADTVEGSIAKAEKDARDYTDQQFDTINPIVGVAQVTKDGTNYQATEADKYEFTKHTGAKADVQLTFTPISPLSLTVPETMGDIEQGTKCEDLNGMPLSQVLDSILFKTIYPTVTNPSGSISFKSGFTNNATVEAGLASPTDANMQYSFNKGKVVVSDGVTANKDYVGEATGCTYVQKYTPGSANTNAGVEAGGSAKTDVALDGAKMTVGQYQFKGTISYGAGPTITDSKGQFPNPIKTTNAGNVANPHAASTLTTSYNCTLNVTLPVFIDNAANGTFNKQPLKTWGAMTFTGVAMADQTAAAPTQIKTPRKLQTANSYNAVSGKYDVAQLSNYAMEETAESINGVSVKYYLYKWTGGALGAVNFEIKTY